MSDQSVPTVIVAPGGFRRDVAGRHQEVRVTPTLLWHTIPVTVGLYAAYRAEARVTVDPVLEVWDGEWRPGPLFSQANAHGDDVPVVGVSHSDCLGFAAWLSRREDRAYRLPTEAEFEFAARAGCDCHVGCGGTRVPQRQSTDRAWPDAFLACWQAALQRPNPSGLRAMNGVLWQWCSDWYAPYPAAEALHDPAGPAEQPGSARWKGRTLPAGRVIRGGSYSYPEHYGQCDNRHFSFPGDRNVNLGFRLVAEAG